jgi:glutamate--cysteine ligase
VDYERQIEEISKYIKSGEKKLNELKLGIELEHFIIDKESLKTISYYGENGVAETLKDLEKKGWKGYYEGEYILGANKGKKAITLEPGSQFELSLEADIDIKEIEKEYFEFLNEIIPILESKGQGLMATGYHPLTKIDEIKILPKKRYDYMFNYFKRTGTHAHNMMKGTAALQISVDYLNEEDYRKKIHVINALSPVMYAIFENARYFEGNVRDKHAVRAFIWENTDKDRSGIVPGALREDFGYEKYAEYILNNPPILEIKNGVALSTGDKKVRELFNPDNYDISELEHFLTMFFPDVRTKRFMEIRMMDAVPYPLNFSAIAMWKGIIYNNDNLDRIYEFVMDLTEEDILKVKYNMMDVGMEAKLKGKSLLEIGRWLVSLSKEALGEEEKQYINPLEDMLAQGKNPYLITKEKEKQGKREALDWCLLNNIIER